MIFTVPTVLEPSQLEQIRSILEKAEFVDGKLTAGWHAQLVKENQQLKSGQIQTQLTQTVKDALLKNALFQTAVRPRKIHSLLFSRYEVGMSYGTHIDNGLMGSNFWRSDVSFTLFLTAPKDYEGGELVIEGADDEKAYKLDLNSVLVYPSSTLHRVEPVTKGTRLVAVGWVQSLVRDASEREILFDLETARRAIFVQQGKTPEFDLISKSIANLLRKWAE
ncbi:2OG-Fe(II) oxygenase [Gloeothece citriformis PCC 7424]|uniref:PKHD-type hydroxylase PCC7424_1929 n=1 Tax=Gloeothece citriformis (strain PCC 7424) TaxID=65393 RepID=Y1929_GLOC7|nr:Fe2+-dependent dioxygenase [Gloeothece citriformis]B7KDQ8.1 RecName: Full=PKHD-type hydroxylase PCC7424_1929 [Gloeothece citriformis PCC 7424]ACK70360.1 2OG-Fe(II) oxygenase [Gloeothece citriformis PCC 7424]